MPDKRNIRANSNELRSSSTGPINTRLNRTSFISRTTHPYANDRRESDFCNSRLRRLNRANLNHSHTMSRSPFDLHGRNQSTSMAMSTIRNLQQVVMDLTEDDAIFIENIDDHVTSPTPTPQTILVSDVSETPESKSERERKFGCGYWNRARLANKFTKNQGNSRSDEFIDLVSVENADSSDASQIKDNRSNDKFMDKDLNFSLNSNQPSISPEKDSDVALEREGPGDVHNIKNREKISFSIECSICMSPVRDITSTICGHIFCEECILRAIQTSSKCPTCRFKLTEFDIHPVFL